MSRHVTLIEKPGLIALLSIAYRPETTLLCNYDPRGGSSFKMAVADQKEAKERYLDAIADSRDRGWRVAWTGEPNYG